MNFLSIFIITVDQITKRMGLYYFERNIFFSYLGFTNLLTVNEGINFGCLKDLKIRFLFKYTMIPILLIIIYLIWKSSNKIEKIALNLILGGGISNTLDRFLFNGVIDFIEFNPYFFSPIMFNVADISITFGVTILIVIFFIDYIKSFSENN